MILLSPRRHKWYSRKEYHLWRRGERGIICDGEEKGVSFVTARRKEYHLWRRGERSIICDGEGKGVSFVTARRKEYHLWRRGERSIICDGFRYRVDGILKSDAITSIYPAIVWFWVLIKGSTTLHCYFFIDLVKHFVKLFWRPEVDENWAIMVVQPAIWPTRLWFFTSDLVHRSYGMIYGE
jgi:hypothetical protein